VRTPSCSEVHLADFPLMSTGIDVLPSIVASTGGALHPKSVAA